MPALPAIIMLTVRPADSDFRYPLACALQALGHPVTYIMMQRRPLVTDMASGRSERWSLPRLVAHFAAMRRMRRSRRPVIFNSTNLAFPRLSIGLRAISGTRWCLDMHDRLTYDSTGWMATRMAIEERILVAASDLIVHAAPNLQRLFPKSHHIGNASSLTPLPKQDADPANVLVLASVDQRFDFDLLADAARACPDRRFDIYGRIQRGDAAIQARMDALTAGHANLTYRGGYTDTALPDLLSHYVVSLAPYVTDSVLTDYIDPLRFYHCLASDVGIVSTPIAQALTMADRIEVLRDVADLDGAFDRAMAKRAGPVRTWDQVAARVSALLSAR